MRRGAEFIASNWGWIVNGWRGTGSNAYGLGATVVVMLLTSIVTGRTDTRYGFATLVTISITAALLAVAWIRRTDSALSQKVAAMRTAGLVRTVAGADARSKKVTLTAKAKKIVDLLAAEWRATEAAIGELEAELPYPMTKVVDDVEEALARRSFHDRITEKLQEIDVPDRSQ